MRINIHAHVRIDRVDAQLKEIFPDDGRPAPGSKPRWYDAERAEAKKDPDKLVALLDKLRIDHMIISGGPWNYLYWVDAAQAIPFHTMKNEAYRDYCAEHRSRLSWLATVPGQDVPAACDEVDRAVELGTAGIMAGTDNLSGRELDDPALWPFYDKLVEHGLVLFLHPYPMNVPTRGPDRYHLNWGPGYAYQETLAFARLTLGGVFDDFPSLKVHITHGCGFVPYQIGRINTSYEMEPEVRAKKPPIEYLDNFFFDIQLHDLAARRFFYEWAGADRLVVGDNFGGWDAADGFAMLDELDLPPEEKRKIEGENAIRFFGLDPVLAAGPTSGR